MRHRNHVARRAKGGAGARAAGALGLAVLLAAAPAAAQEPAAAGVTLDAVVRATLSGNPAIQIGGRQVDARRGELTAAGGAFDARLGSTVGGGRDERLAMGADGTIAPGSVVTRSEAYSLTLSRLLRAGILLQPELKVSRSEVAASPLGPTNSASVSFAVVMPLLRDRMGRVTASTERATREALRAEVLGLRHTTAGGVLEAVNAYWGYLAAHERLAVYAASEERAARLAEETRALVRAEERPAADLNQLLANVSSKRIARIGAEQAVVEAQRRLGLAMGLSSDAIAELPAPVGAFPAALPYAGDTAAVRALVAQALERRADLAQARVQGRSSEILVEGARSALKPRLDLNVAVGYAGLGQDAGLDGFVSPLYQNVPGANASVQLQYQFPLANSDARGRAVQRGAVLEQQRLSQRDLERRVGSGVRVASESLRRSLLSLREAEGAIELFRNAVRNERTKNELGAATLFDVITAEDNLTGSMLSLVSSRLGYAAAIAALRFETGSLVDGEGAEASVSLLALTTPPAAR